MPTPATRRGVLAALTAGALTTGLSAGLAPAASAAPDTADRPDFTLTVLHANDFESALLPIERDGAEYGGAALMTSTVERARRQATEGKPPTRGTKRGVVTIGAGDNFLPSAQLSASRQEEDQTIYDAVAFTAMGYDVSAIGNHDFDLGPDFLAEYISQVNPQTTFVAANLDFTGEPELQALRDDGTIVSAHVVVERGERVGVIGLTTPELPELTSLGYVQVDPALAQIANAQATVLEAVGVNKIILVSHLQDIDNELALVPELDGIDVVVGGGGGEVMADADEEIIPGDERSLAPDGQPYSYPEVRTAADGAQVPVVTTSGLYRYVGELVVTFDDEGDVLSYDEAASRPVPVASVGPDAVRPDPRVVRQVVRPVERFVAELAQTVVATTQVPLNGLRGDIRSTETNLGDLVADALLVTGQQGAAAAGVAAPVVAIQNGGGIRNDSVIPPGPLTALDVNAIVPFTNFVAVAPELPIEDFVTAVQHGASSVGAGSFAQVAGFSYTASATGELASITLDDGTPIVTGGQLAAGAPATVSLASIDFLLRGNDGYDSLGDAQFTVLPQLQAEALASFLSDDLGGVVTGADYPVGGLGRITIG